MYYFYTVLPSDIVLRDVNHYGGLCWAMTSPTGSWCHLSITDIPFSNADSDRDYRSYKIQFQGPPSTGLFTWRVYLVSDTFIGKEIVKDITVRSFPLLMYGMIPDMGFFVTVEI